MPELVKFVVKQWLVGACLVTGFASAIMYVDAWGLGTLIFSDANPILTGVIFIAVGVVLLAPLVAGTAIFLASSGPDDD